VDHLVVGEDAEWGPGVPTQPLPNLPQVVTVAQLSQGSPSGGWPVIEPADIALLQYTGGTTGLPRAAMLTHENLTVAVASYHVFHAGFGRPWAPGDRVIGVLPLFHIYMLTTVMLRCLKSGAEIMLRLRFDPAQTVDDIEHGRATAFPGVPTMFIAIVAQPGLENRDFSSLKLISSGGAPLPVEVAQRFESLTGQRVGGGWGMTETSPAGTFIPTGMEMRPGLIGLPLPGSEIRVRGPNVSAGYWNRPDETASSRVDGFFLTGDIGYMDEQGHFYIVDRKKDMIISGGFNVYPRVIEDAIYEMPGVEECAVIGVPDPYRGQSAKAFVKLRNGVATFTIEDLRTFLADKLARHELPAALEFREQLPRTPVGKLSRKTLADEEASRTPKKEHIWT
jgi:long-chain acyl-CoA synthetase